MPGRGVNTAVWVLDEDNAGNDRVCSVESATSGHPNGWLGWQDRALLLEHKISRQNSPPVHMIPHVRNWALSSLRTGGITLLWMGSPPHNTYLL